MSKKRIFILLFVICMSLCAFAEKQSVLLNIEQISDSFLVTAKKGFDPDIQVNYDEFLITGYINAPLFSVKNIENIKLLDPNGNEIPVFVDKSSLYSEFDDEYINSLKIAFIVKTDILKLGSFRFVWGSDINSTKNKYLEKINIYTAYKDLYKTFTLETSDSIDDLSYNATINVIVDDYADKYYLWYLLPVILIFALIFFRRFFR